MVKRELTLAAVAAALLTAGTAYAQYTPAPDCMSTCQNYIGNYQIENGDLYRLTSCTQSGGSTTCTYSRVIDLLTAAPQ